MVTTLALYEGKTFSEFELVGLTTNPEIIATVLELMHAAEPHVLPVKSATPRRGKHLRVVKDVYDDKRA
jgi:hypothetical protein